MGEDLKKMKVTIEGDASSLKKEANSASQEVKKSSETIRRETEKIKSSFQTLSSNKALESVRASMRKLKESFSSFSLKDKTKEFQIKAGIKVPTEEYKELEQCTKKAEESLSQLLLKQEKYEAIGVRSNSREWKSLKYDIDQARNEVKAYKDEMRDMKESGTDVQRPVSIPKQFLGAGKTIIGGVGKALGGLGSGIGTVASKGWGGMTKILGGMKSVLTGVTTAIRRTSGAFAALLQKFTSGIPILKRFSGGLKENGNSFGGSLKDVLKYAFGIRSLFALVNKLRSALVTGFNNLSQYSEKTNSSLSMLMSSLTQLKNAFAAAFAPILNIVAPILDTLIQKIISVVSAAGQLIAALTGGSTYVQAKKLNQNYAASLDKNSKSANNANEANKKLQRTILGFDQINKLDDDTNSSSTKDTGLTGKDMFETVAVPNVMKGLAAKIKDAWKNADFTEIGAIVGRKLNSALQNIPWNAIQSTCNRIAKSIATFLNGFIETVDWKLVGDTLSKGLNTAFGFANAFAQNFHWGSLGDAIGNGINGAMDGLDWNLIQDTVHNVVAGLIDTLNHFIETTDWTKVGVTIGKYFNTKLEAFFTAVTNFHWKDLGRAVSDSANGAIQTVDFAKAGTAVSNAVKGLLDAFIVAVENTNWKQLGEKIRDFLVNIDWNGIVDRLFTAIGAAFGGLAAFLGGLFGDAVDNAKTYFSDKIEECGGNIVKGIFKGITDAVKDIAGWIKENIFTPFMDGFKAAFGIHSPSTVMDTQGGYIIQGLFQGMKNALPDVLNWIGELPGKVKDKLGDAKSWIQDKGSDAIQGMKNGWESVKESKFLKYVGNMKEEVFTKLGNLKERVNSKGQDIISGLKDGLKGNWSTLADELSDIPSKVTNAIPNLFNTGKNAIQNFADGFGSVHIPLPHVSVSWNSHKVGPVSFSTPSFGLNWYAKGGFPETGEMFVARENGPEMVGRMGSRNTVANNGQIVEGIKAGVFEAVVDAFEASDVGKGGDKDVVLELTIKADSETLYRVVRKGQKKYDDRYHVLVTT